MLNISDIEKSEEKIKESEERYRSLFENSLDGIYITTLQGKYIDANPALVKMLGYDSKKELLSINVKEKLYVLERDRPGPDERGRPFEVRFNRKDSSIIWAEVASRTIYVKGKPAYYEGIVRDVTERKKLEKQLKYLSFHDKLTGLYNRAFFEEELKRMDTKRQLPLCFIMGDINSLKLINDAFGHRRGDKLLVKMARLLKKCCRKEDIIARWGGDEFVILLPKTTQQQVENIIERISKECKKTHTQKIPLSISIGFSIKEKPEQKIEGIIGSAEDNMYRRKLLERKSISSSIIASLGRALWEKSQETEQHAERMKDLSVKLGKAIGLPQNKLDELILLSALHDIGKIGISEEILKKEGKLTKKEWEIVKRHSEIGYNITKPSLQLSHMAEAILSHHEWWDGSGYPQGLKGNDIPIVSRVISTVDAYDVMRSGRIYKRAMSKKEAIEEFKRCSGTQFEPLIVKEFIKILGKEN